jgi:hypothetical protein
VLAQDLDAEARWITERLRARADRPVHLVTASTLVHDCRWELRVGADGARARVEIADGMALDIATLDAVVNRLSWLGADGFLGASAADRDYATSERYALGLAWLESLGPRVVNRPAGSGLSGAHRSTAAWRALARSVGLAAVGHTSGDPIVAFGEADRPVLVLDGQALDTVDCALPELPAELRQKLATLQQLSGRDLIEVRLVPGSAAGGWAVREVSFLASMSRFGEVGAEALVAALRSRSTSREICGLACRELAASRSER